MKNIITILVLTLVTFSCTNDEQLPNPPKKQICGLIQDGYIKLATDTNGNVFKDNNGNYINMYYVVINNEEYKVSGITYQLSLDKTTEHYTCVTK